MKKIAIFALLLAAAAGAAFAQGPQMGDAYFAARVLVRDPAGYRAMVMPRPAPLPPPDPTLPTAPTLMDTTQPDTTGYNQRTLCASGCDFATLPLALADVGTGGHADDLTKGVRLTYNASVLEQPAAKITLPYKNMSAGKWIIVETTSSGTSCPASDTRLTIAAAATANLATIRATTARTYVMDTAAGSGGNPLHNYWFRCLTIETTATQSSVVIIGGDEADTINLPHHFVFDRVYIKSPDTVNITRSIVGNGNSIAVIDSTLAYATHTSSDAQSFAVWEGVGPFKLVNNFLSASGEIISAGGAVISVVTDNGTPYNLISGDFEIRRNYFFKPLTWRTSDPSYDGRARLIKNHVECKNWQRVWAEGNVFENAWSAAQQSFIVIGAKSGGPSIGVTWAVCYDTEFEWNRFIDGSNVFVADGVGAAPANAGTTKRLWVHDNLAEGISTAIAGGQSSDGRFMIILYPAGASYPEDYTIEHNTAFVQRGIPLFAASGTYDAATFQKMPGFKEVDNIFVNSTTGIYSGPYTEGSPTLNGWVSGGGTVTTNVFQGRTASKYSGHAGNLFPASVSTIEFVTQSGWYCANCDLAGTSLYKTAGTAGSQIGISNWTTFQQKTCGAVPGEWSCAGGGLPAPTLASLSVTTGPYTGDTSTTLTGTGYIVGTPSTTATFGGVAGDCSVVSTTSIECSTPAHAAGAVDVVVTNPDLQSATLAGGYTYTGSGGPTISSLSTAQTGAARGSTFGEYTLTITGTNFAQGATVLIGGASCGAVVVVSTTSITCTVPQVTAPGAVDAVVTNPGGQAATSSGGFTYTKPVVGRP